MGKDSQNWWKQAKRDFQKAEILYTHKQYDGAAFYSQQSVEKALKSLYIKKFDRLEKVHDLVYLARKLGLPSEFISFCLQLNKAYIETRYPSEDEIPAEKVSQNDAEILMKNALLILQWLEKQL